MKLKSIIIFLLFINTSAIYCQVTKIMGTVRDEHTTEVMPFVNVIIPGTEIGILTDFNGQFTLEFKQKADSISAFLIGYNRITRKLQLNQFQIIDFTLTPQNLDLPEVIITYQGNPAEVIIDKVISRKKKNSIQSFQNYRYDAYTKVQFDANNISERFRKRRLLKKFDFVWTYMDTSTLTGKSYLPVVIIETISEVFFRKSPKVRKEIITASSISGFKNSSVSQFFGNLSEHVDIYQNYISLFQKNFVSPIADFGKSYYKYYLVDSLYAGSKWCYHIMFKPRRQQELTFTGHLWVADTTFAIKSFNIKIADDANLNFINDLEVKQEYEWTNNQFWMLTRDILDADFNILEDSKLALGFYGHRATTYQNFRFDVPEDPRFFKVPTNVIIEEGSIEKSREFWEDARPEKLSVHEQGIYNMVDSIKAVPVFRTYIDILDMAFRGYLKWQYVELGPYTKLFSYNGIEGARFRFGMKTSHKFSKKIQLQGYLAYGTRDRKFKYGGDLIYMFSKNPRRDITASFTFDVEQLGASPYAISTDNILSSLFHRGPNNKLTLVRDYRIGYEHEWFTGLINRVNLTHREMFPLGATEFIIFPDKKSDPVFMNSIFTSEIQIDTRISFRERFVSTTFSRVTISSTFPIIQISYIYGSPNAFNSDYEYHKLILNVSQWFNFATIGWSKYIIETGKIWGTLPYPLLRIHDGNQSFFYDEYAANLMNYYEFVSDTWISATYTHHFSGLLFNKIPLLRKLKWREVAHIRGVFGTLSENNARFSLFPGNLRSFANEPYWEAGAGIENIFKIIRVDAIWRMSHLHDAGNSRVPKFGLFVSLFFSF
ncbi:MAG: DUF5686 family protein [Bacteroidetes bacterium]|nr:DUF5686 family protein [Bacteroidota bacterium]